MEVLTLSGTTVLRATKGCWRDFAVAVYTEMERRSVLLRAGKDAACMSSRATMAERHVAQYVWKKCLNRWRSWRAKGRMSTPIPADKADLSQAERMTGPTVHALYVCMPALRASATLGTQVRG